MSDIVTTTVEGGRVRPIPTTYRGRLFRSRLEARWAVFFDHLGIDFRYEDEGYQLPSGWYVPDFFLPSCATFIEVRGDIARVDLADLAAKADQLPILQPQGGERGPRLMLLGSIPNDPPETWGDWGWLTGFKPCDCDDPSCTHEERYGFGAFRKNDRPWWHCTVEVVGHRSPLSPTLDPNEWGGDVTEAYRTAARMRFWNP